MFRRFSTYWSSDAAEMRSHVESGRLTVDCEILGGYQPLHVAAWNGQCEKAEVLLEAGADVNSPSRQYRYTPLHCAAFAHLPHLEMVTLLLQQGSDVNARTTHGKTALVLAVNRLLDSTTSGHNFLSRAIDVRLDICRALLAAGTHTDIPWSRDLSDDRSPPDCKLSRLLTSRQADCDHRVESLAREISCRRPLRLQCLCARSVGAALGPSREAVTALVHHGRLPPPLTSLIHLHQPAQGSLPDLPQHD